MAPISKKETNSEDSSPVYHKCEQTDLRIHYTVDQPTNFCTNEFFILSGSECNEVFWEWNSTFGMWNVDFLGRGRIRQALQNE